MLTVRPEAVIPKTFHSKKTKQKSKVGNKSRIPREQNNLLFTDQDNTTTEAAKAGNTQREDSTREHVMVMEFVLYFLCCFGLCVSLRSSIGWSPLCTHTHTHTCSPSSSSSGPAQKPWTPPRWLKVRLFFRLSSWYSDGSTSLCYFFCDLLCFP